MIGVGIKDRAAGDIGGPVDQRVTEFTAESTFEPNGISTFLGEFMIASPRALALVFVFPDPGKSSRST